MSRSYKAPGGARPSANVAAAQQIAAQQLALTHGLGVGGTGLGATSLASTQQAARNVLSSAGLNRTAVQPRPLSRTGPRRPAPRGSAAPADGGAIDLSSFTGGQTAQLSTTLPDDSSAVAPAALENEYIVNLQQQVYFLELELNLLKKAGGGGGSTNPTGLRGSGAPNGAAGGSSDLNDANVPDAPLDDVMLSLREKYVRQEAEFKKEQGELKGEIADLRSRARMRELELANLKQLHHTLAEESARWKASAQEHQSTLLDHQLANEQMILKLTARLGKRESKLEKVLDELVHLRAEHKVTLEGYAEERASYTEKWNEREKKMDELNEAFLREKETNLEWAERFRQSNEAKLIAQLQEVQQQQLALESGIKKAELQREQAEKNRQSALESLDKIIGENEQLRAALLAMESEARAMREKEERDRASKSFWSAEVATMQAQIAALTDKLARSTAKYTDSKQLKKQLKDELIKSRSYLDELQARLAEEQQAHAATRSEETKVADDARELKRDLQIKTDELNTLMARFKEVRDEGDATRKERDSLHVQLTELQAKLEVSDALSKVKLHEFVSMAHSNLKVAESIEHLMSKMKKGESEVKGARRQERSERRRDREDELYSDAGSAATPRTDSRPSTQDSLLSRDIDSRPNTGASGSLAESSFDGV